VTRAARGAVTPLLVAGCVLLAGACARIPDQGPVVDGAAPDVDTSSAAFDFSPPGPEAGATPEQVVEGFLTAQQATPLSTTVARQFLTDRAAADWQPERRTLLYGDLEVLSPAVPSGRSPTTVPTLLQQVFALDRTGRWVGRQRAVERTGLQLSVVRDGGEWRVADPPDALVLPLTHFDNRYRRFAIYFADPTGTLMVPEPVYHPLEVHTPTQLVEALLAGPQGSERRVDRTYLPSGTELVVSVPVDAGGVARVPLSAEMLELGRADLTVAVAQLVWTLRQVPDVTAIRLTADGEPVSVPGAGEVVPVDGLDQFSPLVATASTDRYGVRSGKVRRVGDAGESTLLEVLPRLRPLTGLGVSLLGNPVAVADAAGRVHVLARASDQRAPGRPVTSVVTGPVTRPLWDWSRALWLVPRRFEGRVTVLVGGRTRTLAWPGPWPAGRTVQAAALSRDGSRLVLAVARGGGSELLLSRVLRSSDEAAAPVALRAARTVVTGTRLPTVLELGWRDTQTLAVLVRDDRQRSRVLAVPVDGQRESGTLNADSDVLFGRPVAMAADPVSGEVRVTTAPEGAQVMSGQGRWQDAGRSVPLRLPTFVG
jgi:hypothetical protein